MLTLLFTLGILVFAGKILIWGIKAAWGIAKVLLFIIGLPLILFGLITVGLVSVAVPVLVIALAISFIVPLFS